MHLIVFKYEGNDLNNIQILEKIDELDIIMSLRSQLERHNLTYFESLNEYAKDYCITNELMGDRDFIFYIQDLLIEILILVMRC